MKIFYWLIIIMDITLIVLLWVYISDLYLRDHLNGMEYTTHLIHSDQAIPIIGLGVLLNTGAIIYAIFDARKRRRREQEAAFRSPAPPGERELARQSEIEEMEKELQHVMEELEELRRSTGKENET